MSAVIKVVGVGGGGGNAVQRMIESGIQGVEFIVMNTDVQVLDRSPATKKVQLGINYAKGLGAGGDPASGRASAEESKADIRKALEGADMVFITACMGGGTGTGAAEVIADVAQEMDALTVAVVTKPFKFEGVRRERRAEEGIKSLLGKQLFKRHSESPTMCFAKASKESQTLSPFRAKSTSTSPTSEP